MISKGILYVYYVCAQQNFKKKRSEENEDSRAK